MIIMVVLITYTNSSDNSSNTNNATSGLGCLVWLSGRLAARYVLIYVGLSMAMVQGRDGAKRPPAHWYDT